MRIETKQNFISVDQKTVRNSYGEFFTIGETVKHQDEKSGIAIIVSFELDMEKNEIKAFTDNGYAYIDFLIKNGRVNYFV